MAYSGKTTNYDLPIFESNDKGNWYDVNTGNNIIDGALEANKQSAETANAKADSNTNALEVLNNTVAAQGENINKSTQDISNLEQTVDLHTTHLNEIDVINQNQTQRITAMENTQSGQGTEINQIKSDITEISGLVQQNTQNLATAETEIQALQDITDTMQDDINKTIKVSASTTINLESYLLNGNPLSTTQPSINAKKIVANGYTETISVVSCNKSPDGTIPANSEIGLRFTYGLSDFADAKTETNIVLKIASRTNMQIVPLDIVTFGTTLIAKGKTKIESGDSVTLTTTITTRNLGL